MSTERRLFDNREKRERVFVVLGRQRERARLDGVVEQYRDYLGDKRKRQDSFDVAAARFKARLDSLPNRRY